MASLLGWLGKKAQAVEAQVNPFDNGATYNTVMNNRAPVQSPQQLPSQTPQPPIQRQTTFTNNLVRGTLPAPNNSNMRPGPDPLFQGFNRMVVKPITNTVAGSIVEPARSLAATVTNNPAAKQAAEQRKFQALDQSLSGQILHATTRSAAEIAATARNKTYHPNAPIEKALFGTTPVQTIPQKIAGAYRGAQQGTHPGLAIPAAIGEGLISVAQDLPVAGAAAKVIKGGVKTALNQAKEFKTLPTAVKQGGYVGKIPKEGNVPQGSKLSEIQNTGGRPAIQKQLEDAHNAGDVKSVKQIIDSMPQNDQYKPAMLATFKNDLAKATSSVKNVSPVSQQRIPRIPQLTQKSPKLPKVQSDKIAVPPSQSGVSLPNIIPLKQRGLTTSVKNSAEVSPQLKKVVSSGYTPSNLAEKALNADSLVKQDLNKATNATVDTLSKPTRQLTDQDTANAIATMKANDAAGNLERSQQIHDLLAEHGTQHGQFINAFKLLSNRTPDGMLFGARRALKKAGVELDKGGQIELANHINIIKKTQVGTPERDLALHNLITFVHGHMPSSAGDKIVNFWRAGLLTSPITTGGNILGNTGEAIVRNLWTNPVATAADTLQSLVTGKRTKTLAGGQTRGAIQGLKDSAIYLKTGFDKNNPVNKFDAKTGINYGRGKVGKVVGGYVNGVYRGLGAQDKPFRQAAQNQAAIDLAKADAKNLKLNGQAKTDYIKQASTNPDWKPQTFKTTNDSQAAGAFAVFANETALGKTAALIKQPFTVGGKTYSGAIRQFILPFSQVPASIAVRILHRSDLGATEIVNQILRVRKGLPYDQRAISEAIGNGTFGPGAIAAGYALSKSGTITGNYPTDVKEQEIWKSQGKQANSVKIGNRWYSLNYLQPFGTLLGIGDQIQQDEKAGKSSTDVISNAGARAAKSVESQSFLQGINGLLSAVNDPQRSASQYINSTASSIVPNIIRTGARATDPYQRDAKGIGNAIKGALPGARETLPITQDMFGQNLKAPDNAFNQVFNPFRPSLVKKDPIVDELARLQGAGQGIIPTQFNKTSISGQKLTSEQVRQLQTLVGTPTYNVYKQVMNDPRYAALSDEQKKAALASAGAKQSDAYKRQFSTENNISLTKPATKATQTILSGGNIDYLASKPSKTTKPKKIATTKTTKTTTIKSSLKISKAKSIKSPKALTSSFKTTAKIKAPKLPKTKIRKITAFKAPHIHKLAVSKIPTNYTKRRQIA